jgi:hypothetical protein
MKRSIVLFSKKDLNIAAGEFHKARHQTAPQNKVVTPAKAGAPLLLT